MTALSDSSTGEPNAPAIHRCRRPGGRRCSRWKENCVALPLGLGKANLIANALYARAVEDLRFRSRYSRRSTLGKPHYANKLQRRFLEPVIERLFGDWPQLAYAHALRKNAVPANIEINEFFFPAGQWLNVPLAQQGYISTNYTHAVRAVMSRA